jgi:hypothetical protein
MSWRRLCFFVALLAHGAAATAATGGDLPARLADLLRQLDSDQSRKLTRQIEPSQSKFRRTDLGHLPEQLPQLSGPALLVVGKRGPLSDSPLELETTLSITGEALDEALSALGAKARTRDVYLPNAGADSTWSSAIRSSRADDPEKGADARAVVQALTRPRTAAFVFLLKGQGAVERIVVIPDTVMITVAGDAAAAPATTRRTPPPTRQFTPPRAPYSPSQPSYPMPPPEPPEPVPPPDDVVE